MALRSTPLPNKKFEALTILYVECHRHFMYFSLQAIPLFVSQNRFNPILQFCCRIVMETSPIISLTSVKTAPLLTYTTISRGHRSPQLVSRGNTQNRLLLFPRHPEEKHGHGLRMITGNDLVRC